MEEAGKQYRTILPQDPKWNKNAKINREKKRPQTPYFHQPSLVVIVLALIVATVIGRSITKSLREIADETQRIRSLEFDDREYKDSIFLEMSNILQAFTNMKVGLRGFQKYVPLKLVRILLQKGEDPQLGGTSEELTIFFSDIRGFSTFSERMEPTELAEMLGGYLQELTDIIIDTNGTVDKFIGDAVVALWNAPLPVDDHAYQGVIAALRCQKAIEGLPQADLLYTRIGVHTATVMVGNFGSPERLSYTMLGDGVNLAARLEGVNNEYGTRIIISEVTYQRVKDRIDCRKLDRIAVKGKKEPTDIFEAIGEKGKTDNTLLTVAGLYEEGLEAYFNHRFDAAVAAFDKALALNADDMPSQTIRQRCQAYQTNPPDPAWDGVHIMTTK